MRRASTMLELETFTRAGPSSTASSPRTRFLWRKTVKVAFCCDGSNTTSWLGTPAPPSVQLAWSWPLTRTRAAPGTSDSTSTPRFSPPQTFRKDTDGPSDRGQATRRTHRAEPALRHPKCIRREPVRIPFQGWSSPILPIVALAMPPSHSTRAADGAPSSGRALRQKTSSSPRCPPTLGRCPTGAPALSRSAGCGAPPCREVGRSWCVERSKKVAVTAAHCLTKATTAGRCGW
mmetsp:Transcript_8309/g.24697  ORF Transcript_8309/g.24697 Transcript_8309/m.24697 type:complete len:233 (+) Transcript_8309:326-1024(+)